MTETDDDIIKKFKKIKHYEGNGDWEMAFPLFAVKLFTSWNWSPQHNQIIGKSVSAGYYNSFDRVSAIRTRRHSFIVRQKEWAGTRTHAAYEEEDFEHAGGVVSS